MKLASLFLLFNAVTHIGMAQYDNPPLLTPQPKSEVYYDEEVVDLYQFLENPEDSVAQSWFHQANDYSRYILSQIPQHDELHERLKQLEYSSNVRTRLPIPIADKIFYRRELMQEKIQQLLYADSVLSNEVLLFSTQSLNDSSSSSTIDYLSPSPNGSFVAFGVSEGGSEQSYIYIIEVSTKKILSERIPRAMYGYPVWLPDESGFFYHQFQELTEKSAAGDLYLNSTTKFHSLNTSHAADPVIFSRSLYPELGLDSLSMPHPVVSLDGDHLFIKVYQGTDNHITVYRNTQFSIQDVAKTENITNRYWQKIINLEDQVTEFAVHDSTVYLLSHKDAPRYKLMARSLDGSNTETILPEGEAILNDIQLTTYALYAQGMYNGASKLFQISLSDNAIKELSIPFSADITINTSSYIPVRSSKLFITLIAWNKAKGIYCYDPVADTLTETLLQPQGPYDAPENIVVEEVEVPSHDGVLVPLTLVYKKGLARDGRNPTLLEGYGAYGFSLLPYYQLHHLAWYEKGGIYATAHVRGGGEKGEDWQMGGKKATKANSWKDFIACAEYLVDKGYASSETLAAYGVSAGGITIGRAVTERPELFNAALIRVGMMNTLRHENRANKLGVTEYGTVKDSLEFGYLREMDAYHHVEDSTAYPAMLFTAGMNDARVPVWQPGKMVARLQQATTSQQPVLFRIDMDGGHFSSSALIDELTDRYAFLFWQLGHADFQINTSQNNQLPDANRRTGN